MFAVYFTLLEIFSDETRSKITYPRKMEIQNVHKFYKIWSSKQINLYPINYTNNIYELEKN